MEEISQSLEYKTDYQCSEPGSTPSLLGLIALCIIPVIAIAAAGYYCTRKKHEDTEYEEEKAVERPLSPIKEGANEKVVGQGWKSTEENVTEKEIISKPFNQV